mmetsp:Transcript_100384/g.169553  ORF Transcript_100384/g.169553 Transcript_100384/m.169553 type:complete len:192 (+) Transcript_100384:512-1087(+)
MFRMTVGNGLLQRCNFSRCHRWCQGQQLVDRLGAGVPQQGVMHFTSGAVCVVSRIPASFLCDKFGRRWPVIGGLLLMACASGCIPLLRSWIQATVLQVPESVGETFVFTGIVPYVTDLWEQDVEARVQASSLAVITAELGQLVGSPLLGLMCAVGSVKAACWVSSAGLVLGALQFWMWGEEAPHLQDAEVG